MRAWNGRGGCSGRRRWWSGRAISTLHAFCARVLRQHFSEAGIDPAFELMDEDEARLIREEVLDEVLGRWHAAGCGDGGGAGVWGFF